MASRYTSAHDSTTGHVKWSTTPFNTSHTSIKLICVYNGASLVEFIILLELMFLGGSISRCNVTGVKLTADMMGSPNPKDMNYVECCLNILLGLRGISTDAQRTPSPPPPSPLSPPLPPPPTPPYTPPVLQTAGFTGTGSVQNPINLESVPGEGTNNDPINLSEP
ncbi:hypothetical protein VKT23_016616 [Stygiomarasmius scandens]|uniref:Uncharacterized protein n=1 Tax=Marasmiellus scandens TaxID=2682957 RepID=A0ABR1IW12_9AGAR